VVAVPGYTLEDIGQAVADALEVTDRELPFTADGNPHGIDRRALRAACFTTVLSHLLGHPAAGA
jgi:hypothetical protein